MLEQLRSEAPMPERLAPPRHVKTPMGPWNFFRGLELPKETEEEASIEVRAPDGVEVARLDKLDGAQRSGEQRSVGERLMKLVPRDAMAALHQQLVTGGLLIRVRKASEPIIITHDAESPAYRNTLIVVEDGAECTILERFRGDFISHVAEVYLGANASATYANIQETTTLIARRHAHIDRDARMHWFELNMSPRTFSRIQSQLAGEDAETSMLSIFLGTGLLDTGAEACHEAPRTRSGLLTKGALRDGGRAVYEGILSIGTNAEKSEAFQEEDTLLLDPQSEAKASPMLYINNNDVRCSHAATTSKVDRQKLFYLLSRGLGRREAEQLLVKAFVWPVLERLPEASRGLIMSEAEAHIERFARGG